MIPSGCILRHTGIVVNNIQEWSLFLTEILGLELISDALETGPQLDSSLGLKDLKIHVRKYSDRMGGKIELLSFESHTDNHWQKQEVYLPGIRHIALTVNNIELTMAHIQNRYGDFKGLITTSSDGRVKMAYVGGPEGCLFELVEELK